MHTFEGVRKKEVWKLCSFWKQRLGLLVIDINYMGSFDQLNGLLNHLLDIIYERFYSLSILVHTLGFLPKRE